MKSCMFSRWSATVQLCSSPDGAPAKVASRAHHRLHLRGSPPRTTRWSTARPLVEFPFQPLCGLRFISYRLYTPSPTKRALLVYVINYGFHPSTHYRILTSNRPSPQSVSSTEHVSKQSLASSSALHWGLRSQQLRQPPRCWVSQGFCSLLSPANTRRPQAGRSTRSAAQRPHQKQILLDRPRPPPMGAHRRPTHHRLLNPGTG
jgi:hypothetical protein